MNIYIYVCLYISYKHVFIISQSYLFLRSKNKPLVVFMMENRKLQIPSFLILYQSLFFLFDSLIFFIVILKNIFFLPETLNLSWQLVLMLFCITVYL